MSIPVISAAELALFLDVDGTLIEIAATPDAVVVPESLKITLGNLWTRLGGALALVSGRSVRTLDTLFDPHRFTAAGVHGCERREPDGNMQYPQIDATRFRVAREELTAWTRHHDGSLLEDKGYALALHYRQAPSLETAAYEAAQAALARLGDTYELLPGKFVFEIRPSGCSKGSAIQTFMGQPPFAGRTPMFLGDDVTDESGFVVVNRLGGTSVRIGDVAATAAQHRLANVKEVLEWLETV